MSATHSLYLCHFFPRPNSFSFLFSLHTAQFCCLDSNILIETLFTLSNFYVLVDTNAFSLVFFLHLIIIRSTFLFNHLQILACCCWWVSLAKEVFKEWIWHGKLGFMRWQPFPLFPSKSAAAESREVKSSPIISLLFFPTKCIKIRFLDSHIRIWIQAINRCPLIQL